MSLNQPPTPSERERAVRRLAGVRSRARRRRRTRVAGVAGATVGAVALAIAIPAVWGSSGSHQTVNVVGQPSTTTPAVSIPNSTSPTTATTAAPPSTTATSAPPPSPTAAHLPVSVQSDSQMRAAGNQGPSSSILAPTSCVVAGATATATGGYTNGGFAPNVYNRYGDVVMLYVYTAPLAGYPQGIQEAQPSARLSPPVGGYGTWKVTEPVDLSPGQPHSCVVAAQPTHDVQLAP